MTCPNASRRFTLRRMFSRCLADFWRTWETRRVTRAREGNRMTTIDEAAIKIRAAEYEAWERSDIDQRASEWKERFTAEGIDTEGGAYVALVVLRLAAYDVRRRHADGGLTDEELGGAEEGLGMGAMVAADLLAPRCSPTGGVWIG